MTPTHVQTQTAQVDEAGGSSVTMLNFAVGSGSNRSLVAIFYMFDDDATAPTGSSVVFNTSESFTYRTRSTINFSSTWYLVVEVWTLDNPSNATANIVATASEVCGRGIGLAVMEFTGANNGVGTNFGGATGNSNAPSVTFTTGASDSLIVGAHINEDPGTFATPGTGVTERADWQIWWPTGWAGHKAASGGSDTMSTTLDAIRVWAMAAIELKAASTGTTVNLSAAALTAGGQALTVTPGAVSAAMNAAALAASGPQLQVTPGAVSLAMSAAVLAAGGQAIGITPGAVSTALLAAVLAAQGQAITIDTGGPVTVNLSAATLSALGQILGVTPGEVILAMSAAALAASGQAVTVTPGAVSLAMASASLVSSGQVIGVTPGAVSMALLVATILAGGQSITVTVLALSVPGRVTASNAVVGGAAITNVDVYATHLATISNAAVGAAAYTNAGMGGASASDAGIGSVSAGDTDNG